MKIGGRRSPQPQIVKTERIGTIAHWRNEAARRKCNGDGKKANSKQIVKVPLYYGVSAALMRTLKSRNYRKQVAA